MTAAVFANMTAAVCKKKKGRKQPPAGEKDKGAMWFY